MPEHRWLVLRFEGPLAAFGGVAIDQMGITRDFPAASMLAGMLGNALGYRREQWEEHQRLQDRLVFAARRDLENPLGVLTDVQNAQLSKTDRGWTSWGTPEGRDGASYGAPHRRSRDYHADTRLVLVLRLEPQVEQPDLKTIAAALRNPVRPLFIGRKPCLPSRPIWHDEIVNTPNAYSALQLAATDERSESAPRALWPLAEGPTEGRSVHRIVDLADMRNWRTGLHGGTRQVVEGFVSVPEPTL